jgi:hypothetical protein
MSRTNELFGEGLDGADNLQAIAAKRLNAVQPQVIELMSGSGLTDHIKRMTAEDLNAGLIVKGELNERVVFLINIALMSEGISITRAILSEDNTTMLSFSFTRKNVAQEG